MQNPIKVLIIDDSMLFRTVVSKGLSEDPTLQVVGSASNPYEARDKILELKPEVLTLDVEMPRMNGIEFLKILMQQMPMPVVMVSAVDGIVFEAMRAGAVDFVEKPSGGASNTAFIEDLRAKIRIAYTAKITKVPARVGEAREAEPVSQPAAGFVPTASSVNLIAIGASTGGTEATSAILRMLPQEMPGIVITQHMPPVFTRMYAERLNRECALSVKEAANGDIVTPGWAYVAPGDMQMRVTKKGSNFVLQCAPGEKVSGHCPSVDVLFESVAASVGDTAVGIILTGMGADGAKGMLTMRNRGAYTIGQDQRSCVVYGMPMEAHKLGAVVRQASLDVIPMTLMNYLRKKAI